jgi:type II secretory pathway component PulJ
MDVSDFAAKRLYKTAQGFSPGLSSAKSALKVAAEARIQAVLLLFERRFQRLVPLSGHIF